MGNINVKLSSVRRICCIKNFLFLALVAILFGGAEPFVQFW